MDAEGAQVVSMGKHVEDVAVDRSVMEMPADGRLGISISVAQMDLVRMAFLSDLDRRRRPAPSMARWILRALDRYLGLTPEQREELRRTVDRAVMDGRKLPHALAAPWTMRGVVERVVLEERRAGRRTNGSELAREALALAVMDARARAGGSLPVVVRG